MSTAEAIENNVDIFSVEMAAYKFILTMYYEFQFDKRYPYMRHR